MSLIEVQW